MLVDGITLEPDSLWFLTQKARKEVGTEAGKSFTLVTGQALGPFYILKSDTRVPVGNGVSVVHTWKVPA